MLLLLLLVGCLNMQMSSVPIYPWFLLFVVSDIDIDTETIILPEYFEFHPFPFKCL